MNNAKASKYFVVIANGKVIGREAGMNGGAIHYGYKARRWADKLAEKVGGDVYSIQGQDFDGLRCEGDHYDLAVAARKQFIN